MVDDLVAKILDDDCNTHNDIFTSQWNNTVQQCPIKTSVASDYKTRLSVNSCLTNTNSLYTIYPLAQLENDSININENNREYRNTCNELNSLNLNMSIEEENYGKANLFTNGCINHIQRYAQ
jgi:hypothetical protein